MSKVEYPKFLYHKTEPSKIVHSIEEHKKLGKEWRETPFEKSEISIEKEPESETESNAKGLDESKSNVDTKDRKYQRVK